MSRTKRDSLAAFQSFNALRNLQGTPLMTEIDTDKLRALDEAATPELKTVSPRIMAQLLRLGAEHQRPRGKDWERAKFDADGLLISTLLNGLPAILAMAEERGAWAEAVTAIMARCEALEDEASDGLERSVIEHARGVWSGQKMAAKSIRRELHDLTRALGEGKA